MYGVPIFDFPVLSDGARPVSEGGRDEARPGQIFVSEETVWRLADDRTPDGDPIGEVYIQETLLKITEQGAKRLFVAHFDFPGYGPIVVNGFVPGKEGSWKGIGRAQANGAGRAGNIRIEGWNPKSWG